MIQEEDKRRSIRITDHELEAEERRGDKVEKCEREKVYRPTQACPSLCRRPSIRKTGGVRLFEEERQSAGGFFLFIVFDLSLQSRTRYASKRDQIIIRNRMKHKVLMVACNLGSINRHPPSTRPQAQTGNGFCMNHDTRGLPVRKGASIGQSKLAAVKRDMQSLYLSHCFLPWIANLGFMRYLPVSLFFNPA